MHQCKWSNASNLLVTYKIKICIIYLFNLVRVSVAYWFYLPLFTIFYIIENAVLQLILKTFFSFSDKMCSSSSTLLIYLYFVFVYVLFVNGFNNF